MKEQQQQQLQLQGQVREKALGQVQGHQHEREQMINGDVKLEVEDEVLVQARVDCGLTHMREQRDDQEDYRLMNRHLGLEIEAEVENKVHATVEAAPRLPNYTVSSGAAPPPPPRRDRPHTPRGGPLPCHTLRTELCTPRGDAPACDTLHAPLPHY